MSSEKRKLTSSELEDLPISELTAEELHRLAVEEKLRWPIHRRPQDLDSIERRRDLPQSYSTGRSRVSSSRSGAGSTRSAASTSTRKHK